ncbi:MAG: UDP-N-acetylmuramoyl-L-alanine--D-glutamate ligase [Anaerolineaceae bacterium]|nr:UDP-N-acetylmuramoyl-L-alanine--D-glutamate ligase [Anaerolineaceae bacterium]
MMSKSWSGQRVLIVGAARQGLALARFLSRQGAEVTLNDQRSAAQLEAAVKSMADFKVKWAMGGHPSSLLNKTDLVCVSGGVPLKLSLVTEAQRKGIPISNDSQIFMEAVPCKVVGITGSAGKTTTTTLVGRMAQAAIKPPQKAWIGGNIGLPLIDQVDQMSPDDLVILELSSFQLELMTSAPQVAAILNITPNHLDRHGTLAAYIAAKARILTFQTENSVAVLGREDPGAWGLSRQVRGRLVTFSFNRPQEGQVGTYLEKRKLYFYDGHYSKEILPQEMVRLRGDHNLANVLGACAIAHACGMNIDAMVTGVAGFTGVAHRLEFVRMWRGAAWYNDSIATAPERTTAAIHSFNEPLILLLGGRDKDLPWEDLAELIHQRVDHVILFGEAAVKVNKAIGPLVSGQRPYTLSVFPGLQQAVQAAADLAEPGDVVLLSPGGTSYDEFQDFEERGERFRQWVQQLS